jgi:ribosome-associated toxin RatA of RatAB toxin-antitoxin module
MVSFSALTKTPLEKVWNDLLFKIEHPENFVPGVSNVLILEKTTESVIRKMDVAMNEFTVTLKEKITFHPYKVRFELMEHPTMEGYVDNDAAWISENETEITYTAHWKNKNTKEEINNFELIKTAVLKTIAFIEKNS